MMMVPLNYQGILFFTFPQVLEIKHANITKECKKKIIVAEATDKKK